MSKFLPSCLRCLRCINNGQGSVLSCGHFVCDSCSFQPHKCPVCNEECQAESLLNPSQAVVDFLLPPLEKMKEVIDVLTFQDDHHSDVRRRFEEENSRHSHKLNETLRLLQFEREANAKLKGQLVMQEKELLHLRERQLSSSRASSSSGMSPMPTNLQQGGSTKPLLSRNIASSNFFRQHSSLPQQPSPRQGYQNSKHQMSPSPNNGFNHQRPPPQSPALRQIHSNHQQMDHRGSSQIPPRTPQKGHQLGTSTEKSMTIAAIPESPGIRSLQRGIQSNENRLPQGEYATPRRSKQQSGLPPQSANSKRDVPRTPIRSSHGAYPSSKRSTPSSTPTKNGSMNQLQSASKMPRLER